MKLKNAMSLLDTSKERINELEERFEEITPKCVRKAKKLRKSDREVNT
jgi:DNA repair ATPase RecN